MYYGAFLFDGKNRDFGGVQIINGNINSMYIIENSSITPELAGG